MIVGNGLLERIKVGRSNYYINTSLVNLFVHRGQSDRSNL
jgi:hypothetical protein